MILSGLSETFPAGPRRRWPVALAALAILIPAAMYYLYRPVPRVVVRGVPSCANCTVFAIADALPALRKELLGAVKAENIGLNDISCSGDMLGQRWGHLAYGEVTPFYCQVGHRRLIVDGGNIYLDREGNKLPAGRQATYDNAVAVDHPLPTWKWR